MFCWSDYTLAQNERRHTHNRGKKNKNKNPALSQLEGDERHPAADVIPGIEVFTVPRTSGLNERLM